MHSSRNHLPIKNKDQVNISRRMMKHKLYMREGRELKKKNQAKRNTQEATSRNSHLRSQVNKKEVEVILMKEIDLNFKLTTSWIISRWKWMMMMKKKWIQDNNSSSSNNK